MPLSASMTLGTYEARAEIGLTLDVDAFNSISRSWLNPASPLPTGTLMYSPRRLTPVELENSGKRSASGVLYITIEPFNGDDRPLCAELRRRTTGHRHHFWWDKGSLSKGGVPWAPDACSLWVVNHLGGKMHAQPAGGRDPGIRFLFDFDRAEDEIARVRAALREAEDGWLAGVGTSDMHPALCQENVDLVIGLSVT